MTHILAVAARELRERWRLFPAGLVVGLAPFLLPSFGLGRPEQVAVGALVLAVLLGAVAAFVAGASMLARDTMDGRLAFLFSRPVSWGAIWGGKWLAAVALVFGSALLALLPVSLVYPSPSLTGSWRAVLLGPDGSGLFVVLFLLGIGLANFNATAFRSRSPWLVIDLLLLLLAIRLMVVWVAPLFAVLLPRAHAPLSWSFVFLGVPALALGAASAVQVLVGRTDVRRAHRALSATFWVFVFVVLGAAGLRLAWVRSATPADAVGFFAVSADPTGRWLYLPAKSDRGGTARFLIDTDSGRYVPMGVESAVMWRLSSSMAFAGDGRSGIVPRWSAERGAVIHVDLSGERPLFTDVELESSPPLDHRTLVALSESGDTALVAHLSGVSLFQIPSGRRLATVTNPPGWRPAAVRLRGERAGRAWLLPTLGLPYGSKPPAEMRIVDLAVGAEARWAITPLDTVVDHVRSWPHLVRPDRAGSRVLTHDGGLRLRDGATGTLVATLDEGAGPASAEVFLEDGRVVVGRGTHAQTSLAVFSPDGVPVGAVTSLNRVATALAVGPEVSPGRVVVHVGRGPEDTATFVVDVNEDRVVETLPALGRVGYPAGDLAVPGGGTRHFFIEEGSLTRRDFTTGERRVVAGPGAPAGERLAGP